MRVLVLITGLMVALSGTCLCVLGADHGTEVRTWNGFQITLKDKPSGDHATQVEVKDLATGRTVFLLDRWNVYADHYHCCEYTKGNLYVIRRIRDDSAKVHSEGSPASEHWTDELWRFDSDKDGQKLYSAQGLDFRVSPHGNYIAVLDGWKLVFLDQTGKTAHEKDLEPMAKDVDCEKISGAWGTPSPAVRKWSTDGSEFWGSIDCLYVTPIFYRIDLPSWKQATYRRTDETTNVDKGWSASELDLNPDSGRVVYSTYPFIFDEGGLAEIRKKRLPIHLFIYDLETKLEQEIATSTAKAFEPEWLDSDLLAYNSPERKGRIKRTISPYHATSIDCDKATTSVDKLICGDDVILSEDYELSYYFQVLLSVSKNLEGAERGRLAWLKRRNKCKDARCIEGVYQERKREIERHLRDLVASNKQTLVTEEYSDSGDMYADSAHRQRESMGKYFCCMRIERSSRISFVDFAVRFPDAEQVLRARVPATRDKSGALNFRFVDGWSNWGKGSFVIKGEKCVLNLEAVKAADEPSGKNILRQYGEYALSKAEPGTCLRLQQ